METRDFFIPHLRISVLLIAVAVISIALLPVAMAMISPSHSANPSPIVQNTFTTLKLTGDAGSAPHQVNSIRVYDPANTGATTAAFCPLPGSSGPGKVYELRKTDTTTVMTALIPAGGDTLFFKYGTGVGTVTISKTGGTTSLAATGVWVDVDAGTATPSTNVLGTYTFSTCGLDKFGIAGTVAYGSNTGFIVQKPVGGTILPIDATSLVLAGVFTNSHWTLLVLGAVAAGSFAILRHQLQIKK